MRPHALALLAASAMLAAPRPGGAEAGPPGPPDGGVVAWGEQPALAQEDGVAGLAAYRLPAERFAIQAGPEDVRRGYVRREVTFPSPLQERWPTVHGTYYAPRPGARGGRGRGAPGRGAPAAVVVHHLGGSFEAEAYVAQHLAQHGVHAFAILLPNYGPRRVQGTRTGFLHAEQPLDEGRAAFVQAALDVIRAGDFLRAMEGVDPERVGVVGVSLGAFVAAVARGVDPRLGRTVLLLGGGDLAGLLRAQAPEVRTVEAVLRADGRSLEEFLAPVDPLTFASRIRTEDVVMVCARQDEIVPTSSSLALWRALGEPQLEWINCGHYGLALHALMAMNLTLDHVRQEERGAD